MSGQPLLVGPMIHVGALAPFRDLSQPRVAAIALASEEVVFDPDSWITRPDEPATAMHIVVEGLVRRTGYGTHELAGTGSAVGYPELLAPGVTGAGARADSEVVTYRIETDALRDLCEQDFAILAALLADLSTSAAHDAEAYARLTRQAAPSGLAPIEEFDRVGRMVALQRAPAFRRDHMDALAELAGQATVRRLARGDEVFVAGSPAETFFVVASGSLSLEAPGTARVTTGPGGTVGFLESLSVSEYRDRCVAAEPSILLAISQDPFMDVIEDHFELAFSLLAWLAGHLIGWDADAEAEDGRAGSASR